MTRSQARAKAELMLLKPHDVKGDKAHLGSQGEGESQVCKLLPVQSAGRAGIPEMHIDLLQLAGGITSHLLCLDPRGKPTSFTKKVLEEPCAAEPLAEPA